MTLGDAFVPQQWSVPSLGAPSCTRHADCKSAIPGGAKRHSSHARGYNERYR